MGLRGEAHILKNRKFRKYGCLLIGAPDPGQTAPVWAEGCHVALSDTNLAGCGAQIARKKIDQSRLPRPIRADKSVQLAEVQAEGNIGDSPEGAERFAEAARFQQRHSLHFAQAFAEESDRTNQQDEQDQQETVGVLILRREHDRSERLGDT